VTATLTLAAVTASATARTSMLAHRFPPLGFALRQVHAALSFLEGFSRPSESDSSSSTARSILSIGDFPHGRLKDKRWLSASSATEKQIGRVLDELAALIAQHVGKRSVGTFTLPGLLKIKVVQRPARPARKGVPNPFRPGETMDVAAKPASRRVKVLPLAKLKGMIA